MKISDILNRAAARIAKPNAWIQHAMSTDGQHEVGLLARGPIAWDAYGAITAECEGNPQHIGETLVALRPFLGDERSLITLNDREDQTQDTMVAFLRRVAAALDQEA